MMTVDDREEVREAVKWRNIDGVICQRSLYLTNAIIYLFWHNIIAYTF